MKLLLDVGENGSLSLGAARPHPVYGRGWGDATCDASNSKCLDDLETSLTRCSSCGDFSIRLLPHDTSQSIVDRICDILCAWMHKVCRATFIQVHGRVLSPI